MKSFAEQMFYVNIYEVSRGLTGYKIKVQVLFHLQFYTSRTSEFRETGVF